MEVIIGTLVILLFVTFFFLSQYKVMAKEHLDQYLKQCAERDELNKKIQGLVDQSIVTREQFKFNQNELVKTQMELYEQKDAFAKLQHQKISADVKLGQKAEVLLPFLDSFPYKDDYIVGTYNPIDLIVFREDEVVFVEVKSGQSQLSKSQKKIRDQIKNGKVRFEIHRMNEKGVTVK